MGIIEGWVRGNFREGGGKDEGVGGVGLNVCDLFVLDLPWLAAFLLLCAEEGLEGWEERVEKKSVLSGRRGSRGEGEKKEGWLG